MIVSRRAFTTGALSTAIAGSAAIGGAARAAPGLASAIAAIRACADDHRRTFDLPGLTIGLTAPGGFATTIDAGFANRDARTPITSETLFQIGSISKLLTAALLHQFAAEGRLRLDADFARLMPGVPLPAGRGITVQHVLDHVSGLPGDAPLFPAGGLWLGFNPGEHWHYSNTGYDLLGKLAETVGGKSLDQLLWQRLFAPLGMRRSRGAIVGADRARYAQGYEAADMTGAVVRGAPQAPAAWVDVTFGAGSVGSTAADMNRLLRSIADAAQGRGGLGLGPAQGLAFSRHFVPSLPPGRGYGNGLMRVSEGGRTYLHHTGGMVAFSSAFHVDIASGIGAFASTNLSGLLGYRPRQLTQFAVQALSAAVEGRALPAPPQLVEAIKQPGEFVGRYRSPTRSFEVRGGPELTIISGGKAAPLQIAGSDLFATAHPDFTDFALLFERSGGKIAKASWGGETMLREGSAANAPKSDPALARMAGRFVNDSPWMGMVRIVERGGDLWAGTATRLYPIGANRFRLGDDSWSPERVSFADFIGGRPQALLLSGEKFIRHEI